MLNINIERISEPIEYSEYWIGEEQNYGLSVKIAYIDLIIKIQLVRKMTDTRIKREQISITPYHEFIKMKEKKPQPLPVQQQSTDRSQKHFKSRQGVTRKHQQNSAKTKSIQNTGKCLTEITEYAGNEADNEDFNQFLSKESNSISNYQSDQAYLSIENHNDSEYLCTNNNDKETTFIQGRSYRCSKKKNDRSTDSKRSETHRQTYRESHRSPRNNQGAAHYLLVEIQMIVKEFTKFNRQRITYMDFLEILRELNMIQPNYEPIKDDNVSQLWSILISGAKQNTTCLINLSIIILAIMKITVRIKSIKDFFADICYSLDTVRTLGGNNLKRTSQRDYKRSKEGYFDLSLDEVSQIHNMFSDLRVTRMFLGRINKKKEQIQQKCTKDTKYSFKPHISSKSRSLAKLRKSREHHESTSRFELLEHQIKTQRDKKEMQQCTFQPNGHKLKDSSAGVRRSDILYRMGKKSKSRQKKDRTQDEVQLERHRPDFTFKPHIRQNSKSKSKGKTVEGGAKQIDRMIRARVEKEVKITAVNRGIPYNPKTIDKIRKEVVSGNFIKQLVKNKQTRDYTKEYDLNKFRKQVMKERDLNRPDPRQYCDESNEQPQEQHIKSPSTEKKKRRQIFTFEVFLEQDKCFDGITIYEGDNPDEVAKQFIRKHQLKPQLESKLAQTLTSHLIRILQDTAEQINLGEIEQQSVEYSVQI